LWLVCGVFLDRLGRARWWRHDFEALARPRKRLHGAMLQEFSRARQALFAHTGFIGFAVLLAMLLFEGKLLFSY